VMLKLWSDVVVIVVVGSEVKSEGGAEASVDVPCWSWSLQLR
jgi:hypothetical protein